MTTDPVASAAMTITRELLTSIPAYAPIQSAIVDAAWNAQPPSPVVTPDVGATDLQLFAYERGVRLSIIIGELAESLAVSVSATGAVLSHGGNVIASLDSPTAHIASEISQAKTIVDGIRGTKVLPLLNTFLAQDQDPLAPYAFLLAMSNGTRPRTLELITVATELMGMKIFALKHRLAVQRPQVHDANIVPVLNTPSHLSYPGGHAAKTYVATTLLNALVRVARPGFPPLANLLAAIVSDNRVNAGLHFPVDTAAGEVLGRALGSWLLATADASRAVAWHGADLRPTGGAKPLSRVLRGAVQSTPNITSWRALYAAAAAEWP